MAMTHAMGLVQWQHLDCCSACGYKDGILFSGHSMGRSNYLSQKLVYLAGRGSLARRHTS